MADPDRVPGFKDRLVFDTALGEVLDGPRRYMMLRPDAIMTMFRLLPETVRAAALEALEQAVHQQGSDSARAYLAHDKGDLEALLATIVATAPQLGWGRWQLEKETGRLQLTVRNSPFAHGYGASAAPVCHGIRGMLRGVADLWLGRAAISVEVQCAAQGHAACLFEACAAPQPVD